MARCKMALGWASFTGAAGCMCGYGDAELWLFTTPKEPWGLLQALAGRFEQSIYVVWEGASPSATSQVAYVKLF